jgi:hypothetical protein
MNYNIYTNLNLSTSVSSYVISEYNRFRETFSCLISGFSKLADVQFIGEEWNPDNTEIYTENEYMRINNWILEDDMLYYQDESTECIDNYPLASLTRTMEFLDTYNIKIDGEIVIYNTIEDNLKVVVYEIKDSKFTYRVNKSIEYTRHWKNCIDYYNGNEVLDTDYPQVSSSFHPNIFINFVQLNIFQIFIFKYILFNRYV